MLLFANLFQVKVHFYVLNIDAIHLLNLIQIALMCLIKLVNHFFFVLTKNKTKKRDNFYCNNSL